jgi:ATP-binding cassette subfamily G (WHITE) protein 5 (sterolin 1)
VKEARVKVVLADLALTQLANRAVESLTTAEYRRLTIGIQLVRDPGDSYVHPLTTNNIYLYTYIDIHICIYMYLYMYKYLHLNKHLQSEIASE